MPATTRAVQRGAKLKHVLVSFCGADDTNYDQDPTKLALDHAGVADYDDLIMLSENDIQALEIPGPNPGDPSTPLSTMTKRKLICTIAFHHYASRAAKGVINVLTSTKAQFDHFRVGIYSPHEPIIPWNVTDPKDAKDQLNLWKKSIRPS